MATHAAASLPASCGSVQDLTNPDFCGVGVLASYTAGVVLVFLHQFGFAVLNCITNVTVDRDDSGTSSSAAHHHTHKHHHHASETRPYQVRASFEASSISLFEIAIVLAISWQIAALLSLNSTTSVQSTHDVTLVCFTAYASIAIALGALCTSFDHIRRHKFRVGFCLLSLILCAAVTGMAQHRIEEDNFPKEICLPFFNDYKSNMRKYFVVLSVVFWGISAILLAIICLPSSDHVKVSGKDHPENTHGRILSFLVESRLYVTMAAELLLLVMILLVNHHWVPEQVLRAQAAAYGGLAEAQWTFGQIVGMLIWLPVLTEFVYVFRFGPKEGLEGRIPTEYTVTVQAQDVDATEFTCFQLMSTKTGFTRIDGAEPAPL